MPVLTPAIADSCGWNRNRESPRRLGFVKMQTGGTVASCVSWLTPEQWANSLSDVSAFVSVTTGEARRNGRQDCGRAKIHAYQPRPSVGCSKPLPRANRNDTNERSSIPAQKQLAAIFALVKSAICCKDAVTGAGWWQGSEVADSQIQVGPRNLCGCTGRPRAQRCDI